MKILITGASGFIGTALLNRYPDKKFRKVLRAMNGRNSLDTFHINSVNDNTDWSGAFNDVDVVIHLAGLAHSNSYTDSKYADVNTNGTIHLASEAERGGVKRFIFVSSIGVIGNKTIGNEVFSEDSIPAPQSSYAKSKYIAEQRLLDIASKSNMEVVVIRPVLVYGKNAPGNFRKLVNLVNKVPMLPFALCDNKRSFISVDNLADFISVCIEHPKAKNEIFCISDGVDVSIKEFTNGIAKGLEKPLIQLPVPSFVFSLLGKVSGKKEQIEQLTGDLQVDSSKARELLGWKPPFTMADTFSCLTTNKQ
ncbi:UDP-glucose 4-epimerase [Psychromonas sp. psych-6C06]|uniref:NAD-dependent epimerase/dehydratase family protein n=1 Tax=Psychromonas sp. psych-6C06 TaxID=2058089 RepID=UPI000C33B097|nr:NAD-dependent epimerase/dehydratase family protein [Psychromonas sp. psych-6C06]PKF63056.1 UDP-glucose 4-epimerase [Psychromonas sp. psych-6C06]